MYKEAVCKPAWLEIVIRVRCAHGRACTGPTQRWLAAALPGSSRCPNDSVTDTPLHPGHVHTYKEAVREPVCMELAIRVRCAHGRACVRLSHARAGLQLCCPVAAAAPPTVSQTHPCIQDMFTCTKKPCASLRAWNLPYECASIVRRSRGLSVSLGLQAVAASWLSKRPQTWLVGSMYPQCTSTAVKVAQSNAFDMADWRLWAMAAPRGLALRPAGGP